MVERFHRTMKAALKTRLHDNNWTNELPWILLGLRTSPKEDIQRSSAELVYGEPLTVPGDFLGGTSNHSARNTQNAATVAPVPTAHHSRHEAYVPPSLGSTGYVFVRRDNNCQPLKKPYTGPYLVLEKNNKTFKIRMGDREETVSIDRLKPAHLDLNSPVPLAVPPRRGRPPKKESPQRSDYKPVEKPKLQDNVKTRYGRSVRNPEHYDASTGGRCVADT